VFGQHLTGSTVTMFLFGIAIGAVASPGGADRLPEFSAVEGSK